MPQDNKAPIEDVRRCAREDTKIRAKKRDAAATTIIAPRVGSSDNLAFVRRAVSWINA